MSISLVTECLNKLPVNCDPIMESLWHQSRITYHGKTGFYDFIDEYSSRLVCTALKSNKRLLILFPDTENHRSAMIFASALIWYWNYKKTQPNRNYQLTNNVLYFGSTVGIRTQLGEVGLKNFDIDMKKAFKQQSISRQNISPNDFNMRGYDTTTKLPTVITVFSPANPISIIKEHNPDWISIECSDTSNLDWLQPIMEEAASRNIPIIAWGNNPLSGYIECFGKFGTIFTWPQINNLTKRNYDPSDVDMQTAFYPSIQTNVRPCIITGDFSQQISTLLSKANSLIIKASKKSIGRFEHDTIASLAKYLKALENISVPLSIFEAEADRFWGCSSLKKHRSTCDTFLKNLTNSSQIISLLNESYAHLQALHDMFETNECPIWTLLSNICIEEPNEGYARLIVFTSEAKKQMFLFSLLAEWNFSETDLKAIRVYLTGPKNLNKLIRSNGKLDVYSIDEDAQTTQTNSPIYIWQPIVIGLPSTFSMSKYLSLFNLKDVDFVIYPHQIQLFQWRLADIENRLNPSFNQIFNSIHLLSNIPPPKSIDMLPKRVQKTEPYEINIETTKLKPYKNVSTELLAPIDQLTEIERLFSNIDDTDEITDTDFERVNLSKTERNEDGIDTICTSAIEVHFQNGWHGIFANDDMINVIISKGKNREVAPRFIKSIRAGDEVIIIRGQQKQSLYDLIISRVHKNPDIEVCIALVKKWQTEFVSSFKNKYSGDSRFSAFLSDLQKKGSNISTETSIRFWFKGFVLCPQDPQDLLRIADLLDIEFIKSNKKYIENAAKRLRGLHHSLSLRLNNWLTEQATGELNRSNDDIIDAQLGLTFSDIRDSIVILNVTNVAEVNGVFLRSNLGQVEKEEI